MTATGAQKDVGRSAALMSVLVIISRLTGFLRTWGQAFALGVTVMASCYTVANNLPNQLYELVMGGLISTAFLPVYVSLKRKLGQNAANAYASNLTSIVVVLMAIVCVIGFIFAYPVILTQSAGANSEFNYDLAIYFFRFFVIEVILYALSSLISGLLNAERDYLWSNAAPIFNNLVCTASFFIAYVFMQVGNDGAAILSLALGNPLGVAVQVLLQLPSLKRHGIHLSPRINLRDPALKETLAIGIPSVIAMVCAFVTVSVQSSSALQVTAEGAAVIYYAKLWFTLPYAILAIPITIALFTELSDAYAAHDMDAFKFGVADGTKRILFFLIPFMLFVILFAPALIALFNAGSFDANDLSITSGYLCALSVSLPLYGLCTFMQKVCSSYRKMLIYAIATVFGSVAQVIFCLVMTPLFGINMVGLSSLAFYVVIDAISYLALRRDIGSFGFGGIAASALRSLLFGVAGALVGASIVWLLQNVAHVYPVSFSSGMITCIVAGIPAVLVTYGVALLMHAPEAHYIKSILPKKN